MEVKTAPVAEPKDNNQPKGPASPGKKADLKIAFEQR